MTTSNRLRCLTTLYGAFLLSIIAAANTGALPVSRWLHQIPLGDKLGHFVLMGGLAFLLNLCLGLRAWSWGRIHVLTGSSIVATLATSEELSQIWLANRRFDHWDLAADLVGIVVFDRLARFYSIRR